MRPAQPLMTRALTGAARPVTGLLLLWLVASCQGTGGLWGKVTAPCNPLTSGVLQRSSLWDSTFGRDGAIGCLRVAWGTPSKLSDEGARTALVKLSPEGILHGFDPQSGRFNAPVTLALPQDARQRPRRFFFFAFGRQLQSQERNAQLASCNGTMAALDYRCQPNDTGVCWFSIQFQPTPQSPDLQAGSVPNGCALQLGEANKEPVLSEDPKEPTAEISVEPTTEPDQASKIPETVPDAQEPPEPQTEPATTDKLQEGPPEPVQETPIEPVVETPPTKDWAFRAGSATFDDAGTAITISASGELYLTGIFSGTADFGSNQFGSNGVSAFLMSFSPQLQTRLFNQTSGTSGRFTWTDMAFDSQGNLYLLGNLSGSARALSQSLTSRGPTDLCLFKRTAAGQVAWFHQIGGTGDDKGHSLAVDSKGDVYVTGTFQNEISIGTTLLNAGAGSDLLVIKWSSSGNLVWARQAGAAAGVGNGIAVDASFNAFVAGEIEGNTTIAGQMLAARGKDIFIGKIDSSGTWSWGRISGGPLADNANDVVLDTAGRPIITGRFSVAASFGAFTKTSNGASDLFISKLSTGGGWLWVETAGGSATESGAALARDNNGDIVVTGHFHNLTIDGTAYTTKGVQDIFVAKISDKGIWRWCKTAGGTGIDLVADITTNAANEIFVTGLFNDTVDFGGIKLTAKGKSDIFVWKTGP